MDHNAIVLIDSRQFKAVAGMSTLRHERPLSRVYSGREPEAKPMREAGTWIVLSESVNGEYQQLVRLCSIDRSPTSLAEMKIAYCSQRPSVSNGSAESTRCHQALLPFRGREDLIRRRQPSIVTGGTRRLS